MASNAKKFASMWDDDIDQITSKRELQKLMTAMRKEYQRKRTQFERAMNRSSLFYSHAYETMEQNKQEIEYLTKPATKMNKTELKRGIKRYAEFFRAKSSTVLGSQQIMKEQDARIFGVNPRTGKPLRRMTREQREKFWNFYDEFAVQNAAKTVSVGSNNVQTYLGEYITRQKNLSIGTDMFDDFMAYVDYRENFGDTSSWESVKWNENLGWNTERPTFSGTGNRTNRSK